MKQISLENNDFLNIEVTGSLNLPKIIFSNSLGSDLRMWNLQVEAMKDQFCIIRYDKRGHGKSSPAEGPYSFDMLENDVIKIMDYGSGFQPKLIYFVYKIYNSSPLDKPLYYAIN